MIVGVGYLSHFTNTGYFNTGLSLYLPSALSVGGNTGLGNLRKLRYTGVRAVGGRRPLEILEYDTEGWLLVPLLFCTLSLYLVLSVQNVHSVHSVFNTQQYTIVQYIMVEYTILHTKHTILHT